MNKAPMIALIAALALCLVGASAFAMGFGGFQKGHPDGRESPMENKDAKAEQFESIRKQITQYISQAITDNLKLKQLLKIEKLNSNSFVI